MDDCIFCKIVNKELPSHVVYEDELTLAILDIFPASEGHTLVIPKKHYLNFTDVPEQELKALAVTSQRVLKAILKSEILPQGANVLTNHGEVAGQDVMHFHWHLIPRFTSDSLGKVFNREFAQKDTQELAQIATKIKSYIN